MKNDPSIVAAFLKAKNRDRWAPADGTNPIVTLSRQHGTEGDLIAVRTAEMLTELSHGQHPWVVVDKAIAERFIKNPRLPRQVTKFLTKEQASSIQNFIDGLFAMTLPRGKAVERMIQVIVHLARIGHVILVGRAAHILTAEFPRAAHIRIMGSFEGRVKRIMEKKRYSKQAAAAEIRNVDADRRKFVETHFNVDPDDIHHYDLTFNSDRVGVEQASLLIAQLVVSLDCS